MNKLTKIILMNNLYFLIIEVIFIILLVTGFFTPLMKDLSGSFAVDIQFFVVSHIVLTIICGFTGYIRKSSKKFKLTMTFKYYAFSFVSLIFLIGFFVSYIPNVPLVVLWLIVIAYYIVFALVLTLVDFLTKKNG